MSIASKESSHTSGKSHKSKGAKLWSVELVDLKLLDKDDFPMVASLKASGQVRPR